MTPQQLAKLQRAFLIKTEKQSAVLLDAEFERIRAEISLYLRSNLKPETVRVMDSFLREIIALLDEKVEILSTRAAQIVRIAQRRVINNATESLRKFLPEVRTSIFSPDREAIEKLIGNTQTKESLVKFFARFKPVIAERAKQTLIEGFAAGESSQEIAGRMAEATGAEKFRFLTISRTETNESYRAASRSFYQSAEIKKYVWLSVLDPRTCLICWHLHGRKFKSSGKIFAHPNCRCVIVPLLKNQPPIQTGAEKFLKLETGVQQQILGKQRFELFKNGTSFDEFVTSRFNAEFDGSRTQRFFVKNLSDLESQ